MTGNTQGMFKHVSTCSNMFQHVAAILMTSGLLLKFSAIDVMKYHGIQSWAYLFEIFITLLYRYGYSMVNAEIRILYGDCVIVKNNKNTTAIVTLGRF